MKQLLTIKQVAEHLGVHIDSVRLWVRQNRLVSVNLTQSGRGARYRIDPDDLERFIAARKTPQASAPARHRRRPKDVIEFIKP